MSQIFTKLLSHFVIVLFLRIFSCESSRILSANMLRVSKASKCSSSWVILGNFFFQQVAMGGQQPPLMGGGVNQPPESVAPNVHKYKNPLEKLLQSAGILGVSKLPGPPVPQKPQGEFSQDWPLNRFFFQIVLFAAHCLLGLRGLLRALEG